jgi:tetratricopeptide (TPR) repeat protein
MNEVLEFIKNSFELKNQGYYKPAIEMLYKALAIENDNVEILAQLAQLYNLLDNKQRALHYVEKVLELEPKHLDCLMLRKNIYVSMGKIDVAEQVAESIYAVSNTNENLAEKISLLTQLKRFDDIDALSLSASSYNDIVLYELGYAYLVKDNVDKAVEFFKLGYEQNNKNVKILYNLGKIYYEKNNKVEAKKLFSELNKISPSGEVMNYLGLFKLDEGFYSKAIDFFMKAKSFDDTKSEYLFNLASAYFFQGWFDEAENFFKQAIGLDNEQEKYHFSLAYLYFQQQKFDKALFEIKAVENINPNNEPSKVLRALIGAKKGDLIGAKKTLENLIVEFPLDDFAFSSLSKVYKELSQYELAIQALEHALVLKQNSFVYISELIDLNIETKNYDEAKEYIAKLLEKNKKYVFAYIALAKIDYIQEDFDALYEDAQKIIDLDENSPEGYYYNSVALFKQGDVNFAIETLKKSISLDVNNAALYSKMSEFYQDNGDFEQAFLWAKEASDIDEKSYKLKWMCAKIAVALNNERDAVKYYSLSYRLGSFDEDLVDDYTRYLNSIGKVNQAKSIRKSIKNNLISKNLSLK